MSNFPCAIVYVNLTYGGKDNGPRNTIKAQIFTTLGNIRMGEKVSFALYGKYDKVYLPVELFPG